MKKIVIIISLLFLLIACTVMEKSNQDAFRFRVDDVFQLASGKLVLSGQIESGEINKSEKLKIHSNNQYAFLAIDKMEVFGKPDQIDVGLKNDYVAFTISGISKNEIQKGLILTK